MAARMLCGCSKKQLRQKSATGAADGRGELETDDDYYKRRSLAEQQRADGGMVTSHVTPASASAAAAAVDAVNRSMMQTPVKARRRQPSPLLKPHRRVFVMAESGDSFDVWVKSDIHGTGSNDSAPVIEEYKVSARLNTLLRSEQVNYRENVLLVLRATADVVIARVSDRRRMTLDSVVGVYTVRPWFI